jgi:hypothetical protein
MTLNFTSPATNYWPPTAENLAEERLALANLLKAHPHYGKRAITINECLKSRKVPKDLKDAYAKITILNNGTHVGDRHEIPFDTAPVAGGGPFILSVDDPPSITEEDRKVLEAGSARLLKKMLTRMPGKTDTITITDGERPVRSPVTEGVNVLGVLETLGLVPLTLADVGPLATSLLPSDRRELIKILKRTLE